jgi:hypothetical protein
MPSYDRRHVVAALSDGPVGRALQPVWNRLHDLETDLETAAHEYDVAGSYIGKPAERDAKDMVRKIQEVVKELEALSMKKFDQLVDAEAKFLRKYGKPDVYVDQVRREIFPD